MALLVNPFLFPVTVSPASYGGLTAWWKADSLALSDGDPVNTWADSSGSGHTATASGAPTYRANQFNGNPAVEWTTGKQMDFPVITLTGDYTLIAVAKQTGVGDFGTVVASGSSRVFFKNLNGINGIEFFWDGNQDGSSAFATAQTALVSFSYRRSGSTLTFRENKTALTGGSSFGSTAFTVQTIGRRIGIGHEFKGLIAEIILYTANRADAEVDALYDSYLKPKWGLP